MNRICSVLVVLLLLAAPARAQTPAPAAEGPVVVTSGEGVLMRVPDRAWVQITAESRAKGPKDAQKLNAELMSGVLQKLKGAGLPPDAIQTRGYELQPEYDFANGRQTLRGYLARNTIELRVDELPRVGEFIDLAVSAGATSVGGVRFDLKDRPALEREALRLAVEDARRRAEAAALGVGMKVDRIVRIEEHRTVVAPPPRPMARMQVAEQLAVEPPVEGGQIEVRAAVTVTAAIRP